MFFARCLFAICFRLRYAFSCLRLSGRENSQLYWIEYFYIFIPTQIGIHIYWTRKSNLCMKTSCQMSHWMRITWWLKWIHDTFSHITWNISHTNIRYMPEEDRTWKKNMWNKKNHLTYKFNFPPSCWIERFKKVKFNFVSVFSLFGLALFIWRFPSFPRFSSILATFVFIKGVSLEIFTVAKGWFLYHLSYSIDSLFAKRLRLCEIFCQKRIS